MTLIVDVFPILRTPKTMVRSMSEKSLFRGLCHTQHSNPAETLLQSEPQHRYHI